MVNAAYLTAFLAVIATEGVNAFGQISSVSSSAFVSVKDMRFYADGQETFIFSANYWQAMNLGVADVSLGGNRTRLLEDLDAMKKMGINNLRIMASSEGPNTEPFRMTPALMEAPGQYNEAVFDGLDYAMAEIGKRGMKAVMCLNNFWHWSGGFSQYVSWATGNTRIPYPPSWDPKLGDYTQDNSWDTFIQYSARFYNDPQVRETAQKAYRDHIATVINRRNKYTGLLYKDDPTVFSWQLGNEPQSPPRSWVQDTTAFIKSLAPKHMVSVGLESKSDEQDYMTAHDVANVDYATIHVWVQNRGVYDMLDGSEANIANAVSWGVGELQKVEGWSKKINKPLVLEEFGMARDNWLALGDKANWYNPEHPTTNKDRYYKAMLGHVSSSHKNGGAYAGFGFWAYAGAARPGNKWISDPPHEAPGWYAVYDKDVSTIEVMREGVKNAY